MNGDVPPGSHMKHKKFSNKNKAKVQVALLDDTVVAFEVEPRSFGEVLSKQVNSHLNLEEAEFFGLQIASDDKDINECWLDPLKPIQHQVKDCTKVTFKFRVMFYTPDPHTLQEYTRYLFTLQVRRDLLDRRLRCSEDTGALMVSYIVQGELGDFDPANHREGYLAGFQFVPNQTVEVEKLIVNYHKSHKGLSAVEADQKMLNIARQLDMYGITTYHAQDNDGTDIDLAVYHMGILVFQNHKKINSFSWGVIRKISFKKKKFLIKLRPTIDQADGNVISFTMGSRNISKGFWKFCLNHHTFFRLTSVKPKSNSKPSIISIKKGSSYRYSGRTKKEITDVAATKSSSQVQETIEGVKKPYNSPQVSAVAPSYSIPKPYNQTSERLELDKGNFSVNPEQTQNNDFDEDSILKDNNFISKHSIIKMKHEDSFDGLSSVKQEKGCNQNIITPNEELLCETKQHADLNSEESGLQFNVSIFSADSKSGKTQKESVYLKSSNHWQYNISSITPDDFTNEGADVEDSQLHSVCESEYSYVDADKSLHQKVDMEVDTQLKNKIQGKSYLHYGDNTPVL